MKIEVANGEIVDKFTILSIKRQQITDRSKLKNIRKEYDLLAEALVALGIPTDDPDLVALQAVNQALWEIEDLIRRKEADQCFDDEFIELARRVYKSNDRRAALKRRINEKTGSLLLEEKAYAAY
ncbi:MAG: DUF6165 family protein [Desulfosarcinaceae bacterium]|nr:DUF6165 family protein [Desulfosarcinaceae bacterium]